MKTIVVLILTSITQFVFQSGTAQAESKVAPTLKVADAYIRTMPPGRTTTAGFLTISNNGQTDCLMLTAESSVSDRVEFHEHQHMDGMMRMRPLPDGVIVPAGQTVMFQPGGLHIMLFNVAADIDVGGVTQLQFNTDHCGTVKFTTEIRSLLDKPMGGMHH